MRNTGWLPRTTKKRHDGTKIALSGYYMLSAIRWFKYIAAGLCLALVFTMRALGADSTSVEGVIKTDTEWHGEVVVQGDVLVPEGVTLTVAPGTKVIFIPSDSTKIEPMFLSMQTELLVRGTLLARGVKDNRISFGPAPEDIADKKPARGDWGGIIFDGPATSKSVIAESDVTMADTGVTFYGASPTIEGCRITDCRYGLVCVGGSKPTVKGGTVTACEYGVAAFMGGRPTLADCAVEKNEQDFITKE